MEPTKSVVLGVRMRTDLRERIRMAAGEDHRTSSNWVRRLIEEELQGRKLAQDARLKRRPEGSSDRRAVALGEGASA